MSTLEAVSEALSRGLRAEPRGAGEVITLPLAMSTGNLAQVYVEQVGDDMWFLTDFGVAASELAMAGVNLETQKGAGASWEAVRRSMRIGPAVFRDDVREFDLAGMTDGDALGRSILSVGEAMLRGEALRALAPGYRRRRFVDTIIQAAGRHHLPVVPDAPMPTKHNGKRRVSLLVEGSHSTFVQAISSSRTTQESFDLAQSILTSAAVPERSLAIVLQDNVALAPWQQRTLEEHAAPVRERDLDAFMERLAS